MRTAFIKELEELSKVNKKIILLTGDLGYTVFENFQISYPDRFINMGVAESNMMGVACGLALSGFVPLVYSIATFATMRSFEQIRDDIAYHRANVKIIGTGAGLSYGHAGFTHHALEDIALMRLIPNITIVCPSDPYSTSLLLRQIIKHPGPVYFRLGKKGEPTIYHTGQDFTLGKGITLKKGQDIAIIVTGIMVNTALLVEKMLQEKDISATIIDMHTLKPLDQDLIKSTAKKVRAIFTLEEHFTTGGLGSAVAEVLSECEFKIKFKRIGILDKFIEKVGNQEYLRLSNNLDAENIVKTILQTI